MNYFEVIVNSFKKKLPLEALTGKKSKRRQEVYLHRNHRSRGQGSNKHEEISPHLQKPVGAGTRLILIMIKSELLTVYVFRIVRDFFFVDAGLFSRHTRCRANHGNP